MNRSFFAIAMMYATQTAAADSAACARCHRAIFDSYQRTAMAGSSGAAGHATPAESFSHASFEHAASGFRYSVSRYEMQFESTKDPSLGGTKRLAYFVGSGATARAYLLDEGGFLFEAPVAYYTGPAKWDLEPGYAGYAYPYTTRPALPGCLACHASFVNAIAGTENKFGNPPFREGGVACERCHGPGEAHIADPRKPMVNPAKLPAARRGSVCAQCHLNGEVRVMRAGATWQTYRAGDLLSDSTIAFVRAGAPPGMRVTSHFEKLAQSACSRNSGERLWCGTCHDPHTTPAPAARAAWYRSKCETCHAATACKAAKSARDARRDDCVGCHMPKEKVTDAQHVVYTDHSIPRRARPTLPPPAGDPELSPFGDTPASLRDVALAYAILAARQRSATLETRARRLLEESIKVSPDDSELLLYLAEIYRNNNENDRAAPLYERAMRLDPAQVTASVGLGGVYFARGDFRRAIELWQDALAKNPGLPLTGTNLALAQARTADVNGAEATLRKIIDLSPGFAPARDLLKRLRP